MPQSFKNTLRLARLRSGLTQDEIAILLGTQSGTKVSRYETFSRVPTVNTVFAYEIILRQRVHSLFPAAYEEARRAIIERTNRLIMALSAKSRTGRRVRKLNHLRAIVGDANHDQLSA